MLALKAGKKNYVNAIRRCFWPENLQSISSCSDCQRQQPSDRWLMTTAITATTASPWFLSLTRTCFIFSSVSLRNYVAKRRSYKLAIVSSLRTRIEWGTASFFYCLLQSTFNLAKFLMRDSRSLFFKLFVLYLVRAHFRVFG